MGESESKASGFNGAVKALRHMSTPAEFAQVMSKLSEETRELVRRPRLPVSWVPQRHFNELMRTAERELFQGDDAKLAEWGRQALLGDLRTVYKMFVRFLSPQYVIERGAKLWDTYVRNGGCLHSRALGERSSEVTFEGIPAELASSAYWSYQRGALQGVAEATGVKNIKVELVEGGGTATQARFIIRWG